MAMIVQHNMTAMNANRQLGISTSALAKSTEKLSSGYRINRAADDAAGLAISEKMRSQIRGLDQASTNASDGISMIQTAEGALNESHSILQRMRELAVQAANGTETDDDRGNIQDEIEQLQEELDRIATDTEFNTMKLLDGSLGAGSTNMTGSGPKFGEYDGQLGAFITSSVAGVRVETTIDATAGGESAIWSSDGKTLKLNLAQNVTYSQSEIDKMIEDAKQEDSNAHNSPAEVTVKFANGTYTAHEDTFGVPTVAGKRASSTNVSAYAIDGHAFDNSKVFTAATNITFTSANEGDKLFISAHANVTTENVYYENGALHLDLQDGVTYTQQMITDILANANMKDYSITIDNNPAEFTTKTLATDVSETVNTDIATRPVADRYTQDSSMLDATFSSSVYGANLVLATGTSGATWDGSTLTLTLQEGVTYTQGAIDSLIEQAINNSGLDDTVSLKFDANEVTYDSSIMAANPVADATALTPVTDIIISDDPTQFVGANAISITSNRYGADTNVIINLDFSASEGKEEAELVSAPEYHMDQNGAENALVQPGVYKLSLQSGREYTETEIAEILAEAGLDVEVKLSGNENNSGTDEPNTLFVTDKNLSTTIYLRGGAGLGDEDAFLTQPNYGRTAGFGGIVLQVGANEGQTMQFSIDDMSSAALGVNGSRVDVSTQKGASDSLGRIDEAIAKVSKQRSLLGAVQNRLEHTIANLDNTAENLQAAESNIRDVDMASEMVTMSKYNILQQAGQSMLAQANQSTQGVLSLLQG